MIFIYLWQNDMSSQSCEKEIVKICIIIDYLNIMTCFFHTKKKKIMTYQIKLINAEEGKFCH